MRFPFFRNRDSVKNGILISIRRTGDGFHPGLFKCHNDMKRAVQFGRLEVFLDVYIFLGIGASAVLSFSIKDRSISEFF